MEINLPVWNYYPKNGEHFVDPMYVPYMRHTMKENPNQFSGECDISQLCELNTWKKQGYADGFVNPALVRKGWGLSFQLMHPQTACPEGWTKGEDGWCVANKPEFGDHGLYSKDAFVPKYQYWNGYAPQLQNPNYKEINEFDMRSVNPWTGDYDVYFRSKPAPNRNKYGHLPAKDSYLA